ncbi:hypothetical protein CDL12_15072 [Handroanthus impetiginosus]|uniref:Uncharacterized protein n=1 Tax=Handroanthus impetiginosus TaxID=429701 RepID=A0A2G9H465_9LAMI|nr:hypothetical protein CDL12_15072 [Handroanthus impetiginosus]
MATGRINQRQIVIVLATIQHRNIASSPRQRLAIPTGSPCHVRPTSEMQPLRAGCPIGTQRSVNAKCTRRSTPFAQAPR